MAERESSERVSPIFVRRRYTWRQRWQFVAGKLRRFYLGHFRKAYVARRIEARRGECARCGACCQLMHRCPWALQCEDGLAGCRIYERRPANCRVFPLDRRDLAERDLVRPEQPCGYFFEDS